MSLLTAAADEALMVCAEGLGFTVEVRTSPIQGGFIVQVRALNAHANAFANAMVTHLELFQSKSPYEVMDLVQMRVCKAVKTLKESLKIRIDMHGSPTKIPWEG